MSILTMKKLTLIAPSDEKDKLLAEFSRVGKYHLINMSELPETNKKLDIIQKDDLTIKMSKVFDCMSYIKRCLDKKQLQLKAENDKTKVAISLDANKSQVTFDELVTFSQREKELYENCIDKADEFDQTLRNTDAEISKLEQENKALQIYKNLDVPFSAVTNTKNTVSFLGIVYNLKKDAFEELCKKYLNAQFAEIGQAGANTSLLVVCHSSLADEISLILSQYNFSSCTFNYPVTALERIKEISELKKKLEVQHQLALDESCDLSEYLKELKILYDCYFYQKQICETDSSICNTQRTFILQCWFPENLQEDTEKLLDEVLSVHFSQYDDVLETENPPTVVVQNKFVQPFTSITDMYSPPNYHEVDPNPVVAVFYWLFMGLIMGDVGYGVLMTLIAVVFVKFMKPKGGMKNLILVIGYSGISTIVWGVLFGGWFAIENFPIPTLLISPLYQPLEMILLCLVLGTVHLIAGIIMSMVNKIVKKDVWSAVLDDLPWVIFDVGLILVLIPTFGGLLSWTADLSLLMSIGMILMVVSMAVLVIFGGRKKKGMGKVLGGLGNIYSIINVVSDVLSYLRLFGLGLTTGVIGMVFNILGSLLMGSAIGIPFAIIVFMLGHALNLAISLLGAYIHDARLQHIEFFGKFYTGEGKPFVPIAGLRKYTQLKQK